MRLSEIITIYLAAAAPFGVAHFQRRTEGAHNHTRLLIASACVALAWPLMLISFLSARNFRRDREAAVTKGGVRREIQVERAKRIVFDSLLRVEELSETMRGKKDEAASHVLFAARESIERYAGLTLADAGAELNAMPSPRELEMCRISGRTGEDLLIAGRCVHRRNVLRLRLQRERARAEMLDVLAEVREGAASVSLSFPSQVGAARRLSEAILNSYGHAINLLSLLDDDRAVLCVARLLDAECARLRRLEDDQSKVARTSGVRASEGEVCTTRAAIKPSAPHTSTNQTLTRA